MKRFIGRVFLLVAVCATLIVIAPSGSVEAEQANKVMRIGYLSSLSASAESARAKAIRMALRELGYLEGHNIALEHRYGEGKVDRAAELAAELVRLKPDIILVTGGSTWVGAAKNATNTIPIVMVNSVFDPVEEGLVESLARPGGNVTGLTLLSKELAGKRLELLKQAIPKVIRVAVLYAPTPLGTVREVKEDLPAAARPLGLTLQPREVRDTDDLEKAFTAIDKERPDGLYLPTGALIRDNANRIAAFALKSRLPSAYPYSEAVDAGGLMSYSADAADGYRRVAIYVQKILKGTRPTDLPVEQPTKFEFVINLKTAKQIGLTIPPNVLARADRVIK
jgi:putative ABC transport system substrate-binding protein